MDFGKRFTGDGSWMVHPESGLPVTLGLLNRKYDPTALEKELRDFEGTQRVPAPDRVPDRRNPAILHIVGATIGIGHNLLTNVLPKEIMEMLLDHQIDLMAAERRRDGTLRGGFTAEQRQAFKDDWKSLEGNEPKARMDPNWRPGEEVFIGYGYNLSRNGMPPHIAERLYQLDVKQAEAAAQRLFPNFDMLSDARQRVLVNMAYNMGEERLSNFKKLRAAVQAWDFEKAMKEMLDSDWAFQVQEARIFGLASMMENGVPKPKNEPFPEKYNALRKRPAPTTAPAQAQANPPSLPQQTGQASQPEPVAAAGAQPEEGEAAGVP